MNDLVVALTYGIGHEQNVDYSNAEKVVDNRHPDFCVLVEAGEVRFQFKTPMEEAAARNVVNGYIDRWEFFIRLKPWLDAFELRFKFAEHYNDESQPNVHSRTTIESTYIHDNAQATWQASEHPRFPSEEQLRTNISDPVVQNMHRRFMGYLQDGQLLAGMAYFCVDSIEEEAWRRYEERERQAGRNNVKRPKVRKLAAKEFDIKLERLDRVGKLSSERGGQEARKARGVGKEFTAEERKFLECAVIEMIEKAAAAASGGERES